MTDRQPTAIRRRVFLSRLLTTTSLVATGAALSPAWGQAHHGSHGSVVRRAPAAVPPATVSTSVGPTFANPPAIVAGSNGNYGLNIGMLQTNLGPQAINVRAFTDANNPPPANAPLVAPTIAITGNGRPVQGVTIALTNNLPAEPSPGTPGPVTQPAVNDTPHGYNTTNLHTHGLHVDPLEDNVYIELQPAANGSGAACAPTRANPVWVCNGGFNYSYNFGKAPISLRNPTSTTSIPAGTYWYHPHKHGSTALQVGSGMVGAFIVRGDLDVVANMPPATTEKVMVVQYIEYTVPANAQTPAIVDPNVMYGGAQATINTTLSVNGQINPNVTMQYGEVQRWRIVNASVEQFFYLSFAQGAGAPQLYAIAVDGVPLTNVSNVIAVPYLLGTPPSAPATQSDAIMNEIAILAPGQRLDLLVRAPATGAAGTSYALQAVASAGATVPTQTLVTVTMGTTPISPAQSLPASSAFNVGALYRPPLTGTIPTTLTQNIQFGFIQGGAGAGGVMNAPPGSIPSYFSSVPFALPLPPNPQPVPPVQPPYGQLNLKLNAVDLWQVTSDPNPNIGFGPHAFHIHINSFRMTQRNGIDISAAHVWRDTVRIDQRAPTQAVPNPPQPSVQFVSQQVDYTGNFVMHCHFLQHEDAGMMWSVNISS
jgi:L-ascorbate oxidase